MSDTPRTDIPLDIRPTGCWRTEEQAFDTWNNGRVVEVVPSDFARQLERELAVARQWVVGYCGKQAIDELESMRRTFEGKI